MLRCAPLFAFALLSLTSTAQRELLDRLSPEADVCHLAGAGPYLQPVKDWQPPGSGRFQGAVRRGEDLWLCRNDRIYRTRWPSGEVLAEVEAPPKTVGLADGGRFVLALSGAKIVELDPLAGRAVREIELTCDEEMIGLTGAAQELYGVGAHHVYRVDLDKGTTTALGNHHTAGPQFLLHADHDFAIGSSRAVRRFLLAGDDAPKAPGLPCGQWQRPIVDSAAVWIDGRVLWMGVDEQSGRRTEHYGWMAAEPVGVQLTVKLARESAVSIYWMVGPERISTKAQFEKQMRRLFVERRASVADAAGKPAPMPILLEAYPGVKVGEVAEAWDLCHDIGFTVIHCLPLEAWARTQPERNRESR